MYDFKKIIPRLSSYLQNSPRHIHKLVDLINGCNISTFETVIGSISFLSYIIAMAFSLFKQTPLVIFLIKGSPNIKKIIFSIDLHSSLRKMLFVNTSPAYIDDDNELGCLLIIEIFSSDYGSEFMLYHCNNNDILYKLIFFSETDMSGKYNYTIDDNELITIIYLFR
jgi:hypothetical protein